MKRLVNTYELNKEKGKEYKLILQQLAEKNNNVSITENGAIGYKTTGHALLDMNFQTSSLRYSSDDRIRDMFIKAFYDDPINTIKWLFFLRDIHGGLGERNIFRNCICVLAEIRPEMMAELMKQIPEYGRYDDMLPLIDTSLRHEVCAYLNHLLEQDLDNLNNGEHISLLAKWLPSINTSSRLTRRYAEIFVSNAGISSKAYRQSLSKLRKALDVTEVKMTEGKWNEIDYKKVPGKANLLYDNAFFKHDDKRRTEYYEEMLKDDTSLKTKTLMPYEIVHKIFKGGFHHWNLELKDNALAELLWEKLIKDGYQNDFGLEDCIVVADGSGSMYTRVDSKSRITAIEVANSLAIYFAEQLKGVYHNKVISFSESPVFIDLDKGDNLCDKLRIMSAYSEVASTNIEAVFDLLLQLACKENVPAEEIPKQVLIVSDMEFNSATYGYKPLFSEIREKFEAKGYKMPELIFWNVCGRTATIPETENENGLHLISGFSQNAAKSVAEGKKDPYENLIALLNNSRYEKIEKIAKKYCKN